MLICADCGHPLPNLVDPNKRRNTVLAAFSLITVLMVGTSVLVLDSQRNLQRQGGLAPESSRSERSGRE
jgi:hypothetical protein